jgi:hypothetical protein
LERWFRSLNDLVDDRCDISVKSLFEALARDKLERGLPRKTLWPDTLMEAVTVNGDVLMGMWESQGGGQWYRYRPHGASGNDTSRIILGKELRQTPSVAVAARCVRGYDEARQKLVSQMQNRAAWEEFLAICQRLRQDLATRPAMCCMDVSFDDEIAFTEVVLRIWGTYWGLPPR